MDRNEKYKVDSWDVEVKSATGAGDSMVAALSYSILNGGSLLDICRITTAAGTVTVSKEGTQLCTRDEAMQSLQKVKIAKI